MNFSYINNIQPATRKVNTKESESKQPPQPSAMARISILFSCLPTFLSITGTHSVKNIANFFTHLNQNITRRSATANLEKGSHLQLKIAAKNSVACNSNPSQKEHSIISFDSKMKIDSKTMASALLTHWTGKDADYLEKNKKAITNLNSSAMLAFSTIVKEGTKLTTSPLPNCLISSTPDNSEFEVYAQQLIKDVINSNPELENKIKNSPGLFKTPILISHAINYTVQVPEDIEDIFIQKKQVQSGITYYPQVDTQNTASNSVTTLYLPDIKRKNRNKLLQGLEKALNKAVDRAEDLIPIESKKTAENYLMN